jgi:hypothetical protein
MMKIMTAILTTALMLGVVDTLIGEEIDASDPTKVYTYAGGGVKYTEYTNGEDMWEGRVTGNLGLSPSDMVLFELGYGWHNGDLVEGKDSGLSNARLRYFHLFPMDYSVASGYRGMAMQLDFQIAGELKGTDGQNVITVGVLPAFGLSERWNFYLALNVINSWDKEFKEFNGTGLGIAPLLVYTPDWWTGSYVQFWPSYSYFFTADLEGEGSGNVDLTLGGAITPKVMWSVTGQALFDEDLKSYRRGVDTGLKNDWNVFANVTTYF